MPPWIKGEVPALWKGFGLTYFFLWRVHIEPAPFIAAKELEKDSSVRLLPLSDLNLFKRQLRDRSAHPVGSKGQKDGNRAHPPEDHQKR